MHVFALPAGEPKVLAGNPEFIQAVARTKNLDDIYALSRVGEALNRSWPRIAANEWQVAVNLHAVAAQISLAEYKLE